MGKKENSSLETIILTLTIALHIQIYGKSGLSVLKTLYIHKEVLGLQTGLAGVLDKHQMLESLI